MQSMLKTLAESGSLKSPQISQTFGQNPHLVTFKPSVASRSRSTLGNHLRTTTLRDKRHDYKDRELSEAYNSASLLPSLSKRDNVHRKQKDDGRPPALASPEIKKMLAKFPDTSLGRGDVIKDIN